MASQRAHPQVIPVEKDEVELEQVVDVNQPFGTGQAEFHHGQQTVPAGYHPGLGAVACKKFKGIVHRAGPHVIKRSRNLHCPYLTPWRRTL
ncbi:hypothetical protein D9M72_518520 [compost metagenome]